MDWYTRVDGGGGGALGDGWKEWKGVSVSGTGEGWSAVFSLSKDYSSFSPSHKPSLAYSTAFFGSIVEWKMMLEL
jgi:hypothetical protein